MTNKNIGYHTRLYRHNPTKICGGSFGGALDLETANRLVSAHFTVTVKPSGNAVFVDREGREITLYLSVDASATKAGVAALQLYQKERELREAKEKQILELEENELNDLMSGLTHDEIVHRLSIGREGEK